jgi:nucleolar protein 56
MNLIRFNTGRASAKNKGRISRYLANKCSIAARVDSFIDEPTNAYGVQLRDQVEERLRFYDTGEMPRKNIDVMSAVAESLRSIAATAQAEVNYY